MILFHYKANYEPCEHLRYYYDGVSLDSLQLVDNHQKINGWLFVYFDIFLQCQKKMALYEKDGMIFIHLDVGIYNLSAKEISFTKKVEADFFCVDFYLEGKVIFSINQRVYFWHHFMHDGSFPEDIFPINVALDKFNNDQLGLINFFKSAT